MLNTFLTNFFMRKKGLLEVKIRAVLKLDHGAKTKVGVGSELCKEFLVQVSLYQGSVLSLLLFAIALDVVTKNVREGLMNEI